MDDLISRQAALDALGKRPTVWTDDNDYAHGMRNQYDMDRLAIETVPSAQPTDEEIQRMQDIEQAMLEKAYWFGKRDAQQWIPVTPKTLPKKVGDYLVTTHSGQIARYIYMGNGTSKEYWMRCVLAWMPLPEPYRPEGDKKHEG